MTASKYRIFVGANGYYIAREDSRGFHHQPHDQGASLGFDRRAAERALRRLEASPLEDDGK
jgi:hypothetical protein